MRIVEVNSFRTVQFSIICVCLCMCIHFVSWNELNFIACVLFRHIRWIPFFTLPKAWKSIQQCILYHGQQQYIEPYHKLNVCCTKCKVAHHTYTIHILIYSLIHVCVCMWINWDHPKLTTNLNPVFYIECIVYDSSTHTESDLRCCQPFIQFFFYFSYFLFFRWK